MSPDLITEAKAQANLYRNQPTVANLLLALADQLVQVQQERDNVKANEARVREHYLAQNEDLRQQLAQLRAERAKEKPSVSEIPTRSRKDVDSLEARGLCPVCEQENCRKDCPKRWFDWAYSLGYHDGCNNLGRHDWAFIVEMCENGTYTE